MSSRTFPISVGERYSSPLIECRETDACCFTNSVTRPIRLHSTRSVRKPVQPLDEGGTRWQWIKRRPYAWGGQGERIRHPVPIRTWHWKGGTWDGKGLTSSVRWNAISVMRAVNRLSALSKLPFHTDPRRPHAPPCGWIVPLLDWAAMIVWIGRRAVWVAPHDDGWLDPDPGHRLRSRVGRGVVHPTGEATIPYQATVTTPSAPSESSFKVGAEQWAGGDCEASTISPSSSSSCTSRTHLRVTTTAAHSRASDSEWKRATHSRPRTVQWSSVWADYTLVLIQ